ncbi:UTP--glucose-1-phosphate uridylyltransferase [candidate division KSB1 bacterium]|nr:UTP--glucose-1-phosphate uridylyltransferase [candidate division KSB1 bacterium]RQW03312.1 MAG: UTP--glucose-1-phosphate uridylyltransferase [candidate division KSB1 bacterium]
MVRKAIITAAGKGTRQYPATNAVQKELFPLVDRDGLSKPTIQIIVEEAMRAGIAEIAFIVQPGGEKQFQSHFRGLSDAEKRSFRDKPVELAQSERLREMHRAITYIQQPQPLGFGHAVYCAREWAGDDPVMLMLGDHVYLSHSGASCVEQLLPLYRRFQTSIIALQRTSVEDLRLFGTVAGEPSGSQAGLYQLSRIVEKPAPELARAQLTVATLPLDTFLTIFGLYLLTPTIFAILAEHVKMNVREKGEIQLTTALQALIEEEGAIGYEVAGERLDMGTPLGYLQTQFKLARHGVLAEKFLAEVKG